MEVVALILAIVSLVVIISLHPFNKPARQLALYVLGGVMTIALAQTIESERVYHATLFVAIFFLLLAGRAFYDYTRSEKGRK